MFLHLTVTHSVSDIACKVVSNMHHREFGSFLWSTLAYGWSIWHAEMLFWLKSHCYYVTLGSVKSTCPLPHLSKKNGQTGEQLMYGPIVSFSLREKVKSHWERVERKSRTAQRQRAGFVLLSSPTTISLSPAFLSSFRPFHIWFWLLSLNSPLNPPATIYYQCSKNT